MFAVKKYLNSLLKRLRERIRMVIDAQLLDFFKKLCKYQILAEKHLKIGVKGVKPLIFFHVYVILGGFWL